MGLKKLRVTSVKSQRQRVINENFLKKGLSMRIFQNKNG